MSHEIDERPLTDEQWEIMFSGPEWDEATIEAMSLSLLKAYDIHSRRLKANAPQSAALEAPQ